jgi:hypothetical protein
VPEQAAEQVPEQVPEQEQKQEPGFLLIHGYESEKHADDGP